MLDDKLSRSIIDLVNLDTGIYKSALDLISSWNEAVNFQFRRLIEDRLQTGNPLYACNACGQPVVFRCHKYNGRHVFYFKHISSYGDCPLKSGSTLTQEEIRCMKYNGAKESMLHFQTKNYLAEWLKKDDRFSNVEVESVVKGEGGWSKRWKKPDVSALFNDRKVVFEIQLSTTFLDVIVSRENFYSSNGIAIFWIFHDFNPDLARATEKDIFFNNKSNVLSVSDESKIFSLKNGCLNFLGYFRRPYFDSDLQDIFAAWSKILVNFDQIKFDEQTAKPYFISFDDECIKISASQKLEKIQKIVDFFEVLVIHHNPNYDSRRSCAAKLVEVGLYDDHDFDFGFLNFVKALLSVRDGKVHFLNQQEKWVWVANYVWNHHLNYWVVFLFAISEYEMKDVIFGSGNSKLTDKRRQFKNNWKVDPKFKQENKYYKLFVALLPRLSGKLKCE